jgi:Ca2+-binding RTX toxin-like protein
VAVNEATTTQDVTVDSVVLTTPDDDGVTAITSDITDGTNSGSNDDTITNNSAPSITGLTEAGASVTLTYMNALGVEYTTVPVIADENGEYTIAIPVTNKLPEGSNELLVKVVDVAGNEATTTQNVTVDPAVNAPTITIAGDSNNDGTYSAAELAVGSADTVTATIEIPSNAIAGDKLTYTVDGGATEVEIELTDENIAAGIPVEVLPEATISATITDTAGNTSGSAMATAFAIDAAQVEITGVAISSSFSEVSLYSGAYLSIGADATLNGSIMTAGYTSIGAKGTLAGDISSGGYTSTGINAIVTGDVLSGDYVTTGASSTISGEIAAVAAITPGAGTSQAVLATNLVLAEQADAKERVADAQKSLKAMAGTPLAESVGNLTLDAGVYVATNISTVAGTTLQLDAQGLNNQTWIFNVSTILALGANTTVEIINPGTEGASGASVIWNSAGYASIGADAEILGTVFAENYITAGANTTIYGPDNTHGGLFSQNNYITLGANATVGSTTASNNASANIVTGTADAEAGSKVTIYYNSGEILTDEAVVEDDGTFTYTLNALEVITLAAEEDKSITASITDSEGIKVESAPFEYNDGLIGSFDDDTLTGTAGIDTITGGIGDDTLEGGDGNDYLIGGAGADTFIWGNGDSGTDHIKDFSLLEGDKLDLSGILNLDLGDTLDEYLNFSSDGTDTTINVFVEGNALTADTPSQKIILDDVDLGNDNVFIINNLYNGDNAGTLIISDVPAIDSSIMVTEIPDSLP